jgi:ribosomal protein L23
MSEAEAKASFFKVVKYPLITEKSVMEVEALKKVTFIVDGKATKRDVLRAVGGYFDVEVAKVNTLITPKGLKKAIVTLETRDQATEVAVALGII